MPVVINEFEVVQDTSGAQTAPPSSASASSQSAAPPPDVDRLLTSRRARELRVRAY